MLKQFTVTTLLGATLILPVTDWADAAVISDMISVGNPTWNRPTDRSGNPLSANTSVPYAVYEIHTTVAGDTLTATVDSGTQIDSFLALYSAPFNPLAPQANLLAADDDGNGYPHAKITKTGLAANTSYYLVISSYATDINAVYPAYGLFGITLGGSFTVMAKPQLSVTIGGIGGGSVSSNPAGISCSSGTCTADFLPNINVELTATPNTTSVFSGWGGSCTGIGSCTVYTSGNYSMQANFALAPKAKIGNNGYSSFNAAYTAASNGSIIQLLEDTLPVSTSINKKLILQGGYKSDYSRNSNGYTVLQGQLALGTGGAVTADRVILK